MHYKQQQQPYVCLFKKGIIGYGLWDYKPLEYDGYIYPTWANVLGWCIAGSSIAMIPTVAIYQILITPGTFCQVRLESMRIFFRFLIDFIFSV